MYGEWSASLHNKFDQSKIHSFTVLLTSILIQTRWFKGEHLHGTVAPRASTLRHGQCISQGVGITVPQRTMDMASKYLQARWSWKALRDHWRVEL